MLIVMRYLYLYLYLYIATSCLPQSHLLLQCISITDSNSNLDTRFSTQFSPLASYKSVLLAISSQESELALNRSSILQHLPSTSNKKLLCEINWFEFGSFAWKIWQYKSNDCGVRIGS